jgi:putative peptide zinc metalloprotease protein
MAGLLTAGRLAPLREELALEPGPRDAGGAPSWTLHDPASGRFFRLGWLEFEILSRWDIGAPAAIAERIACETVLDPTAEEVEEFARFLAGAQLLRVGGPAGMARLARLRAAARPRGRAGPGGWLRTTCSSACRCCGRTACSAGCWCCWASPSRPGSWR